MNTTEIGKIHTPLLAACDYCLLAKHMEGKEKAAYEHMILNSLRHAVENAGYVMYPASEKKADAA